MGGAPIVPCSFAAFVVEEFFLITNDTKEHKGNSNRVTEKGPVFSSRTERGKGRDTADSNTRDSNTPCYWLIATPLKPGTPTEAEVAASFKSP